MFRYISLALVVLENVSKSYTYCAIYQFLYDEQLLGGELINISVSFM
jgi:hypothetical protein